MKNTFASRLTAELPSAIATIAISGPNAFAVLGKHASLATDSPEVNRIYYGQWYVSGHQASEQIVVCRTAEDVLEIHCHGGNAICRRILEDLQQAGCVVLTSQRWASSRKGWSDTSSSDAITIAAEQDLLRVTTDRAAAILLDQLSGALSTAIANILQLLSSGETQNAELQLDAILARGRVGLHLANPWRIVLAGPPNTGKSSLINAIVGWQQAIVHEEAGTTRDWVEAQCAIDGWPVCLSDTAGLRATEDIIESEGVDRARLQIARADVLVAVVDSTVGWQDAHEEIRQLARDNAIPLLAAWNKADLGQAVSQSDPQTHVIATSTIGEPGTKALLAAIAENLVPAEMRSDLALGGVPVPFREHQVRQLRLAREAMERAAIQRAEVILHAICAATEEA
jgi:tRNA modification GTPase